MTNNSPSPKSVSPMGGGLAVLSLTRPTILALALSVIVLALLAPALGGDYLWDDLALVKNNPLVHGFIHWTQWFSRSLFATRLEDHAQSSGAQYFRPIVLLSFALDNAWSGNNPAIAHATNLFLYAGVVVVSFFTLIRWHSLTYGALVAAAWFALHPTHVESSAWISGRTDLFALLGILIASFGVARRIGLRNQSYLTFEILGTVLAYGSKENAIVLPAFYAIEVWMVLGRPVLRVSTFREIGKKVLPQIIVACTYLTLRIRFLPFFTDEIANAPPIPFFSHLQMFLETCGRGAMLTLFPWPLRGQHGLISVSAGGLLELNLGYVVLGALTVLALTTAIVVLFKRRPAIAIALLAFAFCFAPVSNLLPSRLQCLFFERYLVIPHLFAAWVLAILVDRAFDFFRKHRQTTVAAILTGIGLVSFAWVTRERALDYSDAERFWTHELKYNPLSSVAAKELADLLEATGEPLESLNHLLRCQKNASLRRQFPNSDSCQLQALILFGKYSPDTNISTLDAVISELKKALNEKETTNQRPHPNTSLGILNLPAQISRLEPLRKKHPGRIEAELSALYSRLGRSEQAITYAERARNQCRGCAWLVPIVQVYATVGDYATAKQVLGEIRRDNGFGIAIHLESQLNESENADRDSQTENGPAQTHAKVQRLLAIGRYGQAYGLLRAVKDQFLSIPEVAFEYAQVAYVSGDEVESRTVLSSNLKPDALEFTLAEWRKRFPQIRSIPANAYFAP